MNAKVLLSVLVLFSLLASCNMPAGQIPVTQSSGDKPVSLDESAIETAVALTAGARLTEIANSVPPTVTPGPALALTPTPCSPLVTSTTNANVRSGPGTAYGIVGALTLGQTATIVGRNDAYTWWYINYPVGSSNGAWIAGSVVTTSCVPSVVQVVAAPPLPTAVVADNSSTGDSDTGDSGAEDITATPQFTVLLFATALRPDLVAADMQSSPDPAIKGERVYIQVKVTNRGDGQANNFTVQWWSSPVQVACHWTVASLAPHASKVLNCWHIYPDHITYPVKLVVDSGNTVAESNEDNNSKSGTIVVHDAP